MIKKKKKEIFDFGCGKKIKMNNGARIILGLKYNLPNILKYFILLRFLMI